MSSQSASVGTLLSRLDAVAAHGKNRWMARCPAHDDRSPSLSVTVIQGGMVLIHCFAGCPPSAVCEAVGLTLGELFAEGGRPTLAWKIERVMQGADPPMTDKASSRQSIPQPTSGIDWPEPPALMRETGIVEAGVLEVSLGHRLTDTDLHRLGLACTRLRRLKEIDGVGDLVHFAVQVVDDVLDGVKPETTRIEKFHEVCGALRSLAV